MHQTLTANESLERLKSGNDRFTQGLRSVSSFATEEKLKKLAEDGQRPFATILTCSDSRLPAELLFDQGFGDLFVIRVAGNVVAPSLIASMEFAALSFETPLILVMGHSNCGAIKAANDYVKNPGTPLTENLRDLVSRIEPAIHLTARTKNYAHGGDALHESTWNNVEHSIATILEQSKTLRDLVNNKKIDICGAVYDLKTSKVTFMDSQK
jgi:carbonic anhydrase